MNVAPLASDIDHSHISHSSAVAAEKAGSRQLSVIFFDRLFRFSRMSFLCGLRLLYFHDEMDTCFIPFDFHIQKTFNKKINRR